jgi:glucose/arabinose dehydrogenase
MLHGNGSLRIGTVAAEPNTIVISAAGQTGEETMQLLINERVVRTWENIGGDFNVRLFNEYAFRNETPIDVDQVRIAFTNDAFVEGQLDRNLIVDQISIGGDVYQSEHPTTFSTGTWNEANRAAVPGRFQSEWLQQNGFLKFTDQSSPGIVDLEPGVDGSVISIRAKGDVGVERLDLWIDGRRATTFDVTDTLEIYQYAATGNVQANQIRVEYNTDERGLAVGRDANLTVDYIEIDGVRFETESNSTYSSGTGFIGTAVQFGFGHGESLYVNGFFQYEAVVIRDDAFSIAEDSIAVPLAILANDTVADGYTVTPQIVRDPENGVLQFTGGQWLYTPNAEFVGTDEFQYAITSLNGSRQLNSATVRIDVNQSHQQPQSQINPAIASELTPSGKSLILRKYVQLPLGENGRQPRMNAMATTGNRTFIVTDGSFDNEGLIFELVRDEDGNVRAELFMDVGAAFFGSTGLKIDNSSPLNGLRSVAFHPEFATNGKFYTSITSERPDDPSQHYYLSDTDTPVNVESVLVEWSVNVETGQFDPNSFREVFRVGMRNSEHSIRGITFNPFAQPGDEDYGLLYIGHGDGSEQSAISGDGQAGDALGKVLRVDPLATANKPFTSPESNPYFGLPWMIDEAYAIGFRNPHNLTFARDANGTVHLIVTEIGRDNIEEINIVRAGGNYGWADREGVFVHERERFEVNGNISLLPADEATRGLIYPVSMLGHEGTSGQTFVGQALAGGHVIQNGSPQLDDQFIFAEFGTDGRAYHIDFSDALLQTTTLDAADPNRDQPSDLTWLTPQELTILFDHDSDASTTPLVRASIRDVLDDEPEFEQVPSAGKIRADIRFGQGVDGELYVMNKRNGWVYLVTNTVVEIV